MSDHDVVIVSAKRTPIGAFQGALAPLTAPQLGSAAIKAAMEGAPASLVAQLDHTRVGAVVLPFAPPKSPGAGSRLAVEGVYDSRARRKRLNDRRILARTVRAFDPYALSRGAPSTTRPPLRTGTSPFAERRMIPVRSSPGKAKGT